MSFPVSATTFQMSEYGSNEDGEKKNDNTNFEEEPRLTMHQQILESDKKFKRIIMNRAAAKKSRCKKLQYVDDLKKKHIELEIQVKELRSQVAIASEDYQRVINENNELNERFAIVQQLNVASKREFEATRVELERLIKNLNFR